MKLTVTFELEITEGLVNLSALAPGTKYCYPYAKDMLLNKEVTTTSFLETLVCTATSMTKNLHSYNADTVHIVKLTESTENLAQPKPTDAVLGTRH